MIFRSAPLDGVKVVQPQVHGDARGFFLESYHLKRFTENGISAQFVQDNHSLSAKGVLRGLHYQLAPMAQAKLVRVVSGAIWDVVVDLRPGARTFGKWFAETLSAENRRMLFVPEGFAHGYCSLADGTEVLYKASNYYAPELERGIRWNDPAIGITWPGSAESWVLSDKDRKYPTLAEAFPGKAAA